MLTVIQDAKNVRACRSKLKQAMSDASTEHRKHHIGYPGGVSPATIYYSKELGFWMGLDRRDGQYLSPCGLGDPFATGSPAPHVEINIPVSGINRRRAGCFLRDETGILYVGHSGKVGGGKKGIGGKAFRAYYPAWSDAMSGDHPMQVYVLGRLDDTNLIKKLVAYTSKSKEFRDKVKAGKIKPHPGDQVGGKPVFKPEFTGKKHYTTADQVEADQKHGTIVNTLFDHLASAGLDVGNTQARDLYVRGANGETTVLFEVKPWSNTSSVYACIGQLYFHGGAPQSAKLVAVLPDTVSKHQRSRLEALCIELVTFTWKEDVPTFKGLKAVISGATSA